MTERGTVFLVLVLAALGAWLWLSRAPRPASAPPAAPLLRVPAADVARVELAEGDERVVAVRRDGAWADAAGRAWDAAVVADLIETLRGLAPIMVVDAAPADPADYGLGPGATRLALAGARGERLLALDVGERNPAWTGLYVRVDDARAVVLVGAVLRWEMEKLRDARPGGKP
ncbi:MAG TPA: DUF4340 domain-containing protein [Candidatus Binatia bacterium]|nr:DUF4340 domain-containing protein [Candidatus Binatia bacterium]